MQENLPNPQTSKKKETEFYCPKVKYTYARHLDTPLQADDLLFYSTSQEAWEKRFTRIPFSYVQDISSGTVRGHHILPWIRRSILHTNMADKIQTAPRWQSVIRVVQKAIALQAQALYHTFPQVTLDNLGKYIQELVKNKKILAALRLKVKVLSLHRDIQQLSIENKYPKPLASLPSIELHTNMVILKAFPGGPIVVPYPFLLSVLDNIESHFSYTVYVELRDLTGEFPHSSYSKLSGEIFELLENIYAEIGNDAAKVFKLMEPISLGVVLETLDPATNSTEFLQNILDDLELSDRVTWSYVSRIVSIYRDYISRYGSVMIEAILEQYGQEKLHFYPIVRDEGGLVKMYRVGTAFLESDPDFCVELKGLFNIIFINGYYAKNKTMPKVLADPTLNPAILEILSSGDPQSENYCQKIPLADWAEIHFEKNIDYNYFGETTSLLDDKGITPHLGQHLQVYAPDVMKKLGNRVVPKTAHTNLILEMLSRESIDIEDYFKTCERQGRIPASWAVIFLKAKERELKLDPREFSMLCIECRMMASSAERNICDSIFPYFKEQTMTDSGAELKHRVDNVSTLQETDSHIWVSFNLDLEQWNYSFRPFCQSFIITTLNELFGVKHFETISWIFKDSILLSGNKFTPPNTPDRFTGWDHHNGGNQGIFQKFWTIITILVIRRVMANFPYKISLMGSGDNQVLSVQFPKSNTLNHQVRQIASSLAIGFKKIGLTLKASETWFSSDLLAYQRNYIYKSVTCENCIKALTRSFAGGDDADAGVRSHTSTSMAAGSNIANTAKDPLIAPLYSYIECYTGLMLDPNYKILGDLGETKLASLALVNSELGYLPFSQLGSFMYNGHRDACTESLAMLKTLWEIDPIYRHMIAGLLQYQVGPINATSKELLITDPYTLNIKTPISLEVILKNKVDEFFKTPGAIKNKFVKAAVQRGLTVDRSTLISTLLMVTPLNTSLSYGIVDASSIGQIMGIVNMFNRITSVVRFVDKDRVKKGSESLQEIVVKTDNSLMRYIKTRINFQGRLETSFMRQATRGKYPLYIEFCSKHLLNDNCTLSLRLFLISLTFGLDQQLVDGPYSPAPGEVIRLSNSKTNVDLSRTIQVLPASNIPKDRYTIEHTRGPFRLNSGSDTKDTLRQFQLTSLKGIEAGKATKQCIMILTWLKILKSSPRLIQLVQNELLVRYPQLTPIIDDLTGALDGGTFSHRYHNPMDSKGAHQLGTTMISTWIQITTNVATDLSRFSEDRYIFFQPIMQHIIAGLRFSHPLLSPLYAEVQFGCCARPVREDPFTLSDIAPLPRVDTSLQLSLSKDQLHQFIEEARQLVSIRIMNGATNAPSIRKVSAGVASLVAAVASAHMKGNTKSLYRYTTGLGSQSTFNISILRILPLKDFLMDVCLNLCYNRVLTQSFNLYRLRYHINLCIRNQRLAQDLEPFSAIVEALATADRLQELATIAKAPLLWAPGEHLHNLIKLLFQAFYQVLCDWLHSPWPVFLVHECRSLRTSWGTLWAFLRQFSPGFRRLLLSHPHLEPTSMLAWFHHECPEIQVIATTSLDLLVAEGRSGLRESRFKVIKPEKTPLLKVKTSRVTTTVKPWFYHQVIEHHQPTVNMDAFRLLKSGLEGGIVAIPGRIQDIARWTFGSSGAMPKLIEILNYCQINITDAELIVNLAEGAGSFSALCLHWAESAQVIYNSLIPPESIPHCLLGSFIPPACICTCLHTDRLVQVGVTSKYYGDLMYIETWNELSHLSRSINKPIKLLTWDMEGYDANRGRLFSNLVSWVSGHIPQHIIIKLFLEDIVDTEVMACIQMLTSQYSLALIKPSSSHLVNKEIYLVGHRYLKTRSPLIHINVDQSLTYWLANITGGLSTRIKEQLVTQLNMCPKMLPCSMNYPSSCSVATTTLSPYGEIIKKINRLLLNLVIPLEAWGLRSMKSFQSVTHSQSAGASAVATAIQCEIISLLAAIRLRRVLLLPNVQNTQIPAKDIRMEDLVHYYHIIVRAGFNQGDITGCLHMLGELLHYEQQINSALLRDHFCILAVLIHRLPNDNTIKKSVIHLVDDIQKLTSPSPALLTEMATLFSFEGSFINAMLRAIMRVGSWWKQRPWVIVAPTIEGAHIIDLLGPPLTLSPDSPYTLYISLSGYINDKELHDHGVDVVILFNPVGATPYLNGYEIRTTEKIHSTTQPGKFLLYILKK